MTNDEATSGKEATPETAADATVKAQALASGRELWVSAKGRRLHFENGCFHPELDMRPATAAEIESMMFCWDCAEADHERTKERADSCPKCFLVYPCDCE